MSFVGVGKTKLSIELTKKFNGEIINADVMQMYTGVNVATAKVVLKSNNIINRLLLRREMEFLITYSIL